MIESLMTGTRLPPTDAMVSLFVEVSCREAHINWAKDNEDSETFSKSYLRSLMFMAGHNIASLARLCGKEPYWLYEKMYNKNFPLYANELVDMATAMKVRSPLVELVAQKLAESQQEEKDVD